jgi:uncharacterized protein (DUF1501 family)
LHNEGKLTVFPAIGYTHADGSHFTSRHFWEVGATDAGLGTGWLGRYLDRTGTRDNPLQGLSLDGGLHPSLASARVPVAATSASRIYRFHVREIGDAIEPAMLDGLRSLGGAHARSADPALRKSGDVTLQAHRLQEQLRGFGGLPDSQANYPESQEAFPVRLKLLAAMLAAGLPLHCVAMTAPGAYDTHANQPKALSDGLKLTADSLLAFQRDLERRGLADRVLVHVWSEFGRRAKENGSFGTDHGAAGIGFVIGSRASGTMVGEFPGLANGLDEGGNLKATSDFRGVYSALLEQWLNTDAKGIIPRATSFGRPKLVR